MFENPEELPIPASVPAQLSGVGNPDVQRELDTDRTIQLSGGRKETVDVTTTLAPSIRRTVSSNGPDPRQQSPPDALVAFPQRLVGSLVLAEPPELGSESEDRLAFLERALIDGFEIRAERRWGKDRFPHPLAQ